MTTIYVIVENVSSRDNESGDWNVDECLCPKLGYFTDENAAENKVQDLNERNAERFSDEEWELMTDEEREEHETRYGFVPLELAAGEIAKPVIIEDVGKTPYSYRA